MNVLIHGRGVAASCAAHLLGRHGISATRLGIDRPALPIVMLSAPALALLRDVLGQPDLFLRQPRIDRRIVAWGRSEATTMPHDAIVVPGAELEAALASGVDQSTDARTADFTIHATAPLPAGEPIRFGARSATAIEARLLHPDDATACWIEALGEGWLFLIPSAPDRAWLLCIGFSLADALTQSRLIAPRIAVIGGAAQSFDPSPRMASQVAGPDWLACGTTAIAFDPICGDGTAQAVREAILAAAVAAAIRDGGDPAALAAHYGAMLTATMRRHLQLCAPFYRTGGPGPWWQAAHDALAEGHDWCTARLTAQPEPRYQLRGYGLVERERAA